MAATPNAALIAIPMMLTMIFLILLPSFHSSKKSQGSTATGVAKWPFSRAGHNYRFRARARKFAFASETQFQHWEVSRGTLPKVIALAKKLCLDPVHPFTGLVESTCPAKGLGFPFRSV